MPEEATIIEKAPEELAPEEITEITEKDLIDPPKKQTAQERIDEITYKMREEEREKEYWKNLAMEKETPSAPVTPPATSVPGRPSQVNYETVEEYEDALFDWRDQQRDSKTFLATQEKEWKEAASNFNKNAAQLRKEHEDFDMVIETPVFTDTMRKTLWDSDNGPMIAYHIAKNREVSDKLKVLPPERQIYEIGKLETQLLLAQRTKTTTTAPEPIDPVGITGQPEIDQSKMDIDDWMETEKNRELEKLKAKLGGKQI